MLFLPSTPELTVDRGENGVPLRYCIDATTEKILQRQRLMGMVAGGPLLIYAGVKIPSVEGTGKWKRWLLKGAFMLSGVGYSAMNFHAWNTVRKAGKV